MIQHTGSLPYIPIPFYCIKIRVLQLAFLPFSSYSVFEEVESLSSTPLPVEDILACFKADLYNHLFNSSVCDMS